MPNFISEDDIEQSILDRLKKDPFNYEIIICDNDPSKRADLNDGTGRSSKRECVLPFVMLESLKKINPTISEPKLEELVQEYKKDYSGTDIVATNYNLYQMLRNNKKIDIIKNGKKDFEFVKFIDFENVENNTFTAVSQMWIQGRYNYRRPDVILFVNGMPLVFIELKNSIVKIQEAYDKNLQDYKRDIPNLFAFNQICVLSNGIETRVGAFNVYYEHFFEWLRVKDEKEKVDRKAIMENGLSIQMLIDGLFVKERLIDYIENFILFENQKIKIIAKNHQYMGVNNLMESVYDRKKLNGKLGVFWHTQGSGKSYSMIMFARKVKRKVSGNFTFLVITDREDLDTQIFKNFSKTEVIGAKEECRPKNSAQLREYLQTNKPFIFTLIHKFRYGKTKKYPVLTERDDIFVLVDEAHRTQYKDLAENMRTALPNANFVAFTGTPLLGKRRLTNQWFGDYVSEYNFAQSVEDGSTVPLFYSRRVPEVGLQNNFLDDDIVDIIKDEDLNEDEARLLENSSSRILEVIKRDDRLDKVAKDIAHHFPRRGFLGKGLVVSVDKFTTVKMYDKVQHYWQEEIKELTKERNLANTKEKRDELTKIINYMNNVDMAVVISTNNGDDVKKFSDQGLDLQKHIDKMNSIVDGKDLEDRFKDPNDMLSLVFVCAMWLTGFDVKNLSTLYLDKPMKSHTLMQAIARANRVYPDKPCGIIVDYVNVFKYMKEALRDYATGDEEDDFPAKDMEQLMSMLNDSISEGDTFLRNIGVDLENIIAEEDTLDKLDKLRDAYNMIVANDENKERFKVITNTMINLYESSKPEIFEVHWTNKNFSPLSYLHGLLHNTIDDEKIERARRRMQQVLDGSVMANQFMVKEDSAPYNYAIKGTKVIDLSKMDFEQLRNEIKRTPYKAIEIDDMKGFIERLLKQMINKNCTRIKFSERYKNIIDRYNAGGTENEDYYEQLIQLMEELKKESERPMFEGLTEEELELYDLLIRGKKLTIKEEQQVKLAAKHLYTTITNERSKLLVIDWYKDEQPKARVRHIIEVTLNNDLPMCYDRESFNAKTDLLLNHFVDMGIQGYGWINNVY